MIDIEPYVVDKISTALENIFPDMNIDISSEYLPVPDSFPHVSIEQTDSYVNERTYECECPEYSAVVTYQINVYSNLIKGKKTQCKKIMSEIDFLMLAMGFVRVSLTPVRNFLDSTVYRLNGTYRAYVTHDNKIYRR